MLPRLVDGRWERPSSFVTLTYPLEDLPRHIGDARLHKRHLATFWKTVERAYPGSWAIWVLEHQKNGNPHFHLLVRWENRSRTWFDLRRWVASTWSAIVADGREGDDDGKVEEKNRRVGTAVDPLITGDALARYVSKAGKGQPPKVPIGVAAAGELAKRSQKSVRIAGQGRWWGVLHRAGYQASAVRLEVQLPPVMAWMLWTALSADWRAFFERQGKTVGGEDADVPYLPRWLTAERAEQAMRELGIEGALWSGPLVDIATGEEWDVAVELGEVMSA